MKGLNVDDISQAIIGLIRVGAVFRFLYCMVRLQGAEEDQAQYRKRAKNTVMFYVIAESMETKRTMIMSKARERIIQRHRRDNGLKRR